MDYYVVINEQKQGPFDFLAVIKKVKNGAITPETLVSVGNSTNFIPAEQIDEINKVLNSNTVINDAHNQSVNINFKSSLLEGVDLWTRKIIHYTLSLGVIFVIGFGFSQGLKNIQIIADYSFIADYLNGLLCYTMLGVFFYYVLQSKRSQELNINDFQTMLMSSLLPLILFAAILSVLNILYTISVASFVLTTAIATVVFTLTAFVPFLITDNKMGLGQAFGANIRQFRKLGGSCVTSVLLLIAMNTIPALVLGLISPNLMIIGLIITIPITVGALSYIYDQVFA